MKDAKGSNYSTRPCSTGIPTHKQLTCIDTCTDMWTGTFIQHIWTHLVLVLTGVLPFLAVSAVQRRWCMFAGDSFPGFGQRDRWGEGRVSHKITQLTLVPWLKGLKVRGVPGSGVACPVRH